ncbi:MAG TPA: DUF5060 domain-containing protein [Candidatus Paceibacterota bacterium]|nr:DUF5060 domain-containing protein [Verrucomicrobiota bacterium]HRY48801.1 DUF5060 domain-containing protein [Candidatus Paceibacterota bacterium]
MLNQLSAVSKAFVGVLLVLSHSGLLRGSPASGGALSLSLTSVERDKSVPRYQPISFQLSGLRDYANPWDPDEVTVDLEVILPSGRTQRVPAYFAQRYERRRIRDGNRERDWFYPLGNPGWEARYTPVEAGAYEAVAVVTDRSGRQTSAPLRWKCVLSPARGFIRVSQGNSRFMEFTTGEPFFALGQNLAFIGDNQHVSLTKAEEIFSRLSENGANYLRIWTCCEDWAMAIEARKSAWGRSWNWHPPFVERPGPDGRTGRCVQFPKDKTMLDVDPSHRVALRPGTRYVLTAVLQAASNTAVRTEINGTRSERWTPTDPETWGALRHEFTTGSGDFWMSGLRFQREGEGAVWVREVSLREKPDGPELLWEAAMNRPIRGFFNPIDCFMLDELVSLAERHGIYLQLCLLTRDLYMPSLKDPASPAYDQAIRDARIFLRHAVARWGASPNVAAWEYFNEMDPGLPTDRFYSELGDYLEQVDIYRHLRTTSAWGPSPKDCRHPKLDLADVHFYLRPADTNRLGHEVEAVLERTRFLREHAPNKPSHLGEFGLADNQWRLTEEQRIRPELDDVHHALWASALSGGAGSALFWWWERLDQRNVYPLYRPLSRFLRDVPWTSGALTALRATVNKDAFCVTGVRTQDRAWLWLFDAAASWRQTITLGQPPPERREEIVSIADWPSGSRQVRWFETRRDRWLEPAEARFQEGNLILIVPSFTGDIAAQIGP